MLCGEDPRLLHPAPHQQHQVTPAGDGGASEVPPRLTTGPHPRPGVPCDRDAVLRQETGGVEGRLLLRPVSDAGRRLRDHIGLVEIYILLPHPFPPLCGVVVSYQTPPFNPVLHYCSRQCSLRQVVPDVIQPPPLWSSSPSFPRYLHHHHSPAYVFFFSSQYMPIYFPRLSWIFLPPSSSPSFIPNSVHLGDSTHPS